MTCDPMCPYSHVEGGPCEICDLIARVREDERTSQLTMWNRTQEQAASIVESGAKIAWEKFSRDQFDAGYASGLDAAREAVAEWIDKRRSHDFRTCDDRDHDCYLFRDALAAIDALKEKT